jgi:hypothetical protein
MASPFSRSDMSDLEISLIHPTWFCQQKYFAYPATPRRSTVDIQGVLAPQSVFDRCVSPVRVVDGQREA